MNLITNTVLMNTPFGGPKHPGKVYFIGIGGIGMSSLARFFKSRGATVGGFDRTETALTRELVQEGIEVHYEESVDLLMKDAELVVYTPAVPADHRELVWYRSQNFPVVKRSEVLQQITNSSFNICIGGTHGKTTITTLTAHLLRSSGFGCNAFLGGIAVNYNSNYWSSEKNVSVIEADEYDRSFLKLDPNIAVITAMDADHLDIYGTAEIMEQAFIDFSNKVREGGLLITHRGLKRGKELGNKIAAKHITYSISDRTADVYADELKMENGSYVFNVKLPGGTMENVRLNMGGAHNIENALAAITIASSLHIDQEKIRSGVESFKGVRRRFEYIIRNENEVLIDDYAHHPQELKALIQGARELFPNRQCVLIFQPHLYSRTRDLADGFAEALEEADKVILLPLYPARELPMEGVSSEMILQRMKKKDKCVMSREELLEWWKENKKMLKEQVVLTAGAGDIDMLPAKMKQIVNSKD